MNIEPRSHGEPVALPDDDAPAPGGVGETLLNRLGRSADRLENPELPPAWVIHEVRKDLKRVRALLRLTGDVLPMRKPEKRCAAAARQLAPLRDVDAAGETVARLRVRADERGLEALDELMQWLASRRRHVSGEAGLPREVALQAAAELRGVMRDLQGLAFERIDADTLDRELATSFAHTASSFRRLMNKPVMERFHDLRKAVKRELYQRELSGRPLDRMERATLKKLADVLGELQDLEVLKDTLDEGDRWRGPVRKLVKQTRRELKARAIRLGSGRYPEEVS